MDLLWNIPFNLFVDLFKELGAGSLSESFAYGTMFGICWEAFQGFPNVKKGIKDAEQNG